MTFLNPWLLLGVLGAGIPLVIHLLSRRTARRVEFSSLRFLRDLEKKSMRRLRVRQILLLLLRMAAVAAVALAMARPTITGVASGSGRGSTTAVIVLDGSYSMRAVVDGTTLFERAQDRAREVLSTFEDGDEVIVLVPGAPEASRSDGIRDLGLARERISAAEPGLGAVDGAMAVRRAVTRLEEARHPNREVHVVSDFQRTGWPESEQEALPPGIGLFLHPVGEDAPGNAWVDDVDFSGQILEKGNPIEFRVVAASGPGFDPKEVDVEMEVDGQVVDRRRIDLGPSSRVAMTFHETFAEDGIHLGTVVLRSGTGLEEDDRRAFTLRTAREVPVLVVCPDERSRRYLQAALAPEGGGTGSFGVRVAEAHELESASRGRESVIVLADVERLTEAELAGIKAFLSDGGGLLVFPGPHTDAAAWSRSFLPKFLPGTLADVFTSEEPFRIAHTEPSHPLFELFREEGALGDARFTRALSLRPQPGSAVLATYSNGQAALLESALLPGRVLHFTSSLDPAWSDLPLTGTFLPLLHECVRYLSETGERAAQRLVVGDGATVWLPAVPEGGAVTLRTPSGETRAVGPEPGPGGYALELTEANEPGFWIFESQAGDTLAALAAGIDARESDLARLPVAELRDRLGPARGAVLQGDAGLAREVKEARIGREIGRWFLWAAGLFLLAEMLVASRFRAPEAEAA